MNIMPAHEAHSKADFAPYPSLAKVLLSCSVEIDKEGKLAATAGKSGHQQAAAPSGTC